MKNSSAKICVPVCVRRASELESAVKRAAKLADLIELRFDYFLRSEIAEALQQYARLRQSVSQPFVVTFRPAHQGGLRDIETDERSAFWSEVARLWRGSSQDFADIEAELLIDEGWIAQIGLDLNRLICSHHDFTRLPSNLTELYEQTSASGAGITKFAVQAKDATDCLPIFRLLERAQTENRNLIPIAMGQAGVMTRILGPSRGSFLTYGALTEDNATAPAQVTVGELREIYRIDDIDRETAITGLIGSPVKHSISPHIHNAAYAAAGLNAVFIPFEVQDVGAFIRRMAREGSREIEWNLRGLSVTAPHKSAVIQHLHWIDEPAREIGAVNTIVAKETELHGYNTDALAFLGPLKGRLGPLEKVPCAVLGAGGAARAVVWALRNAGAEVCLFARDQEKGTALADHFEIDCYDLGNAAFHPYDVVINATPLGTRGKAETETAATAEQLRGVRLAYDLVYNPLETRFLCEAREAGCKTIGGLEMFIGQAVEQFTLWTGSHPNVEIMRAAAEKALT